MKTNWPDEAIDRVLAERDPRRGFAPISSELDPDGCALLERILAVDPVTAPSTAGGAARWRAIGGQRHDVRPRPRSLSLRLVAAILVVVMAVTVVVGLRLTSTPGRPASQPAGQPETTVSSVLRRIALVADLQRALPVLRPDQFVYTKEIDVDLSIALNDTVTYATLHQVMREDWYARNGAGRIAETNIKQWFLTPADRARWVEAGALSLSSQFPLVNQTGRPGWFRYTDEADVAKLPTEPKMLARRMHVGGSAQLMVIEHIGDLLGSTDASPALRSALYQVAAGLSGVKLLGTVTDSVGRRGTAVVYGSHGETDELIFDPTTSALLENETIVTDASRLTHDADTTPVQAPADTPAGTVVESATYLARGIVDSTTTRPSTNR